MHVVLDEVKGTALRAAGANVMSFRVSRQLSQAEFARKAGIARPVVSKLESGEETKSPSLESLAKIAVFIGCSLADLLSHEHDEGTVADEELAVRARSSRDGDVDFGRLLDEIEKQKGHARPRYSRAGRRRKTVGN